MVCPGQRGGGVSRVGVAKLLFCITHCIHLDPDSAGKARHPYWKLATFASPASAGGWQQRTWGLHPGILFWDMVLRRGCGMAPMRGTAGTVIRDSMEPASQWDHPLLPWCTGALEAAANAQNWAWQSNPYSDETASREGCLSLFSIILGWEMLAMGATPPHCLCFLTIMWAACRNDHPIAFVWKNHMDTTTGNVHHHLCSCYSWWWIPFCG